MADPSFRAAQEAEAATAPHMAPIDAFVAEIADRDGRGWLPRIAPHHGGTDARVLSVLRDPGPATQVGVGSGFLSVENDDPTAERQAALFAEHGIRDRDVLPWNAYPWYINRAPDAQQGRAGAQVLVELVALLPDLEVVLLQGRDAERIWDRAIALDPGLAKEGVEVVRTIHPGRQALFHRDPEERARRKARQVEAFARVGAILAGGPGEPAVEADGSAASAAREHRRLPQDGPMTPLPVTDLAAELREVTAHWTPRVVGRVNDQYVKVAKLLGELTWHAHEAEDEMFLVVSGRLRIQLPDDQEVVLGPGQFHVVPRGVQHNPVADEEVEIVLIETVTTAHTGDVIVPGTVPVERQVGGFR
jgi:mannose-6-phosphate isomerase-like protein (cupin superfamily)